MTMPRMLWVCGGLAACGGNGGAGAPVLDVSPLAVSFEQAPLDAASTADVTVSNLGSGSITLLSATITEGDLDHWGVDRTEVAMLGPSSSGVVRVVFSPDAPSTFVGELLIRTDAGSQVVSLRGTGGLPGVDEDGDGFSPAEGDCDDDNANVYPGAEEICDGLDSDCNGILGGEEADDDDDGVPLCAGDCDDTDPERYPGAEEICDGIDNDCDEVIQDRLDQDDDGISLCGDADEQGPPDCDDLNNQVFPGNPEVCDTFDNDCDGAVDNVDNDGDGRSVCFGVGDCDDNDPKAYPLIVSEEGDDTAVGDDAAPLATLAAALQQLDGVCNTVIFEAGTYEANAAFDGATVWLAGRSGDPTEVTLTAPKGQRHLDVSNGAALTVQDLTLTGGSALDNGGAARVVGADLTLDGVVLQGNASDADGGAVAVTSGTLILQGGVVLSANEAGADGGAVLLDQSILVDEGGSTWSGNTASIGGALRAEGGAVTVRDAQFTANEATEGGAISAAGVSAGGFTVERSVFHLNVAAAEGGALALRNLVDNQGGFVRNNAFQDNVADAGGGVAVLGATAALRLHNNTLAGEEALTGEGAGIGIFATDAAGVDVAGQVLQACDGASALYAAPGSGATVQYSTVFLTNSGNHFVGDIGDGAGNPVDATNAVRNPGLVAFSDDGDPTNDDLALQATSPEIDDGPPDPAFDDPDGTRNDRGSTGGPAAAP